MKMTNAAKMTCHTAEATAAGAMRFCVCSNRNGISTGCCPSTCTARWPADSFARTSAVGVGSAIGNAKGVLVEVLSRTSLRACNCKTGASAAEPVFLRRIRNSTGQCPQSETHEPQSDAIVNLRLHPAGPRPDRRIAAAVGVQQRERVGGARLAPDRDQDAAASGERFEDTAVVRLEADAAHRARDPDLREIARAALERVDERSPRDDRADARDLEPIARGAERLLDERRGVGRVLRENRQGFSGKSRALQRREALRRPRDVL